MSISHKISFEKFLLEGATCVHSDKSTVIVGYLPHTYVQLYCHGHLMYLRDTM